MNRLVLAFSYRPLAPPVNIRGDLSHGTIGVGAETSFWRLSGIPGVPASPLGLAVQSLMMCHPTALLAARAQRCYASGPPPPAAEL